MWAEGLVRIKKTRKTIYEFTGVMVILKSKLLLYLLILGLGINMYGNFVLAGSNETEFAKYQESNNFIVEYPKNWLAMEEEDEFLEESVLFIKPFDRFDYTTNFNVHIELIEENETLDDVVHINLYTYNMIYDKFELKSEPEKILLDGMEAYILEYHAILNQEEYISKEILSVKDNKFYALTYADRPNYFEENIDEFELFVESFRFK